MTSRIIEKERVGTVDRWQSPPVDRSAAEAARGAPGGGAHLLTAKQLETLQQQVHDEAHARGFAQGLAEGRAEAESRAARLGALIGKLARPFDDLDRAVEQELAALVETITVQLLRRELSLSSETLAATAREAVAALPSATRELALRLHPDDARLVAEHLIADDAPRLRIEPDPRLARGDLVVATERSEIDGRVETRVRALLAAADEAGRPTPVESSQRSEQ
jgi:flagellar assembly protein FliH